MRPVNLSQAKSSLSRLAQAIKQRQAREIIITRNGRPAAKLVAVDAVPAGKRIGAAKGKFEVPDDIDSGNAEIARLFHNGPDESIARDTACAVADYR